MSFRDRLRSMPIVLEIVPPRRRASEKTFEAFVQRVQDAAKRIRPLDAINLPEILDENHVGRPFYRNKNPRKCAKRLREGLDVHAVVNKVVVHLDGMAEFEAWATETMADYGLRQFVLVGGSSRHLTYPGPTVVEANARLKELGDGEVTIGNVTIPERTGEVERLVAKTRAGCEFFTTQVLFEPEPMASLLRAYGQACAYEDIDPATVLLSFAPVVDDEDVEFLAWLGASVSPETEDRLLNSDGSPGTASLTVAKGIWDDVRASVKAAEHPVPLGVNVEEITARNFDLAVQMAGQFARENGKL